MTAPARWEPDPHMIDALLSSPKASRRITDMRDGDRAWIIAGLELAGEAAERTAERMGCSLRLVRSLRAEDITQMARLWLTDVARLEGELRAEQCEAIRLRHELAAAERDLVRMTRQRDDMIKALAKGQPVRVCPHRHPLVGYNVYEHGGHKFCRECNRLRKAGRDASKRDAPKMAAGR